MPTIEIADTTLHYEDSGPGSTGETLAFSHGLLWNTTLFAPQIEALRDRYRCIAWDHRGQGRSAPEPRHNISMELVWSDAVELLEKLATGPVHFCGLSMGGFVGMRLAARRPDLVRSLLLLETSAGPEPTANVPRFRLLGQITRYLPNKVILGQAAPLMFGKTFLTDPARGAERTRAIDTLAARGDVWRAVNGVIDRGGVERELSRITAPTLVVVGDEDLATPPAKAEQIQAGIKGSRLVRIPRAGHSAPVEEPAAVTAALSEFLASLRSIG